MLKRLNQLNWNLKLGIKLLKLKNLRDLKQNYLLLLFTATFILYTSLSNLSKLKFISFNTNNNTDINLIGKFIIKFTKKN